MKNDRKEFTKTSASIAVANSISGIVACKVSGRKAGKKTYNPDVSLNKKVEWPAEEGQNTPKICISISGDADVEKMHQLKQIGVDYVFIDGGPIPWKESTLRKTVDRFKAEGLTINNMMISGFINTILGRNGRDDEIGKVKKSLLAAGAVGLPVVEYNFYVDRLVEGYYEMSGRSGSGITCFDCDRVKNLPAKPEIGNHSAEELWDNLTYFLKAVIPVAEKAGVRMSLHPNDPPVPVSHGSAQIMTTFRDWKRLIGIVDSPSNGMTYDCGVCREIGEDPLEVLSYMGSRDRINHLHYRNVITIEPYLKYEEVFYDVGQVNMVAVMKEIINLGYNRGLNPEHPRALDYDKEHPDGFSYPGGGASLTYPGYPGGGGYAGIVYNVAYTRAMMQAVLCS